VFWFNRLQTRQSAADKCSGENACTFYHLLFLAFPLRLLRYLQSNIYSSLQNLQVGKRMSVWVDTQLFTSLSLRPSSSLLCLWIRVLCGLLKIFVGRLLWCKYACLWFKFISDVTFSLSGFIRGHASLMCVQRFLFACVFWGGLVACECVRESQSVAVLPLACEY